MLIVLVQLQMKLLGINGDGVLGVIELFIGFFEVSLIIGEVLVIIIMDKLYMGYNMNYKISNEWLVL